MQITPFNQINDPVCAVRLSFENFARDAEGICSINPHKLEYSVANAMVKGMYYPHQNLLLKAVLEGSDGGIEWLGWCWLERGDYLNHSDDEMASYRYIHLDMDISARARVKIINEFLKLGKIWCETYGIPILCSATIRKSQDAFIKLHKIAGFTCLGSHCYMRIVRKPNKISEGDDERS